MCCTSGPPGLAASTKAPSPLAFAPRATHIIAGASSKDTAAKRATARVVEGLIPVIDGFEHALAAHREAEYENYRKGFELIYKQLLDHLAKLGVERLDPVGKPFDPHLHQAVDRAETKDHDDGTILQVFQPGYVFHGRVLRPVMVRVAVHPKPASKEAVN